MVSLLDGASYFTARVFSSSRAYFIGESLGIQARVSQFPALWESHLQHCRALFKEAVLFAQAKSILILGCGRLYDFETTLFKDREIFLVDADPLALKFAGKIARRAGAKKVGLFCRDCTGFVAPFVKHLSPATVSTIFDLYRPVLLDLPRADLVCSLNVLSQLPLFFKQEIIRKKLAPINEQEEFLFLMRDQFAEFSQSLYQDHVGLMKNSAPFFVASTDQECIYEQQGEKLSEGVPIDFKALFPSAGQFRSWHWRLAPEEKIAPAVSHRVVGAFGAWK